MVRTRGLLGKNLHRVAHAEDFEELLNVAIGEGDTAGGPVGASAVPVDADAASQGGAPVRAAAMSEVFEDRSRFTNGDQAGGRAQEYNFGIGIVDAEEPVKAAICVLGNDAKAADGRSIIALSQLGLIGVGAKVNAIRADEDRPIEKVQCAARFENDDVWITQRQCGDIARGNGRNDHFGSGEKQETNSQGHHRSGGAAKE